MKFSYTSWIRPVVVYGGAPFGSQAREVERGVDILVATPGRLIDMLDRGKVSLSRVRYLCFDEADRMLDMGFEKDIRRIVEQRDMPGVRYRTTTMFSATFPREIRQLAADFLNDFLFLTVGRVGSTVESITQIIKYVEDNDKRDEVIKELRQTPGRTLVFAETKRDTDNLARFLFSHGFPATGIHGDRTQREREAALASFKSGRITVLVATDVASRGLDISDVVHVINYDLPASIDSYVHRIGRTGRAGHKGLATSYFNDGNRSLAKELVTVLKEANQNIPAWLSKAASEPHFKDKRPARVPRRHATRATPYQVGGSAIGGSVRAGYVGGSTGAGYGGSGTNGSGASSSGRSGYSGSAIGSRGGYGGYPSYGSAPPYGAGYAYPYPPAVPQPPW